MDLPEPHPDMPVPASDELVAHHLLQHMEAEDCDRDRGFLTLECPCGTTRLIGCGDCEEIVFVSVAAGTWCEHAERARVLLDPEGEE